MNSTDQLPSAMDRDETRYDTTDRVEPVTNPTQTSTSRVSDEPNHSKTNLFGQDQNRLSVPNEPSRISSTERAEPRPVGSEHDFARTDAVGRDDPAEDSNDDLIVPNINWLDVEQAAELLKERGISRTIRTVQKMCKRGDLNAKLVPTENGSRYIISDKSIDDFVELHNQKLPSGGFKSEPTGNPLGDDYALDQDVSDSGTLSEDIRGTRDQSTRDDHLREIIEVKNEQIAMLQSQVNIKDEQIATMHERDHETNILIQNLQGLVALPERRSETPPPTNAGTGAIDVDHRQDQASSQP